MKVLFLNTTDISGGAARASFRLYKGLQASGIDLQLLVQTKKSDEVSIIAPGTSFSRGMALLRPFLDALPLCFYSVPNKFNFSTATAPDFLPRSIAGIAPDIIHLHWICEGFIRLESIKRFNRPILWTLHDSWAFTGGCHIPFDCTRYQESCGACPALGSVREKDLSRRIWHRKRKAWEGLNLTVVTPSNWLANCAKSSSLFYNVRVEVIPNGLDLQNYKSLDRQVARELLSLPHNKKLIIFNGMSSIIDPNKGLHLLVPALQELSVTGWKDMAELVVFGLSTPADVPDFGLKTRFMGRFYDEVSINLLYAAADVLVLPSMQENLSNTVMEAMACGTPCVAFRVGGIPEMIDHGQNGFLAIPYDTSNLAEGIGWILGDEARYTSLAREARKKVESCFSLGTVAEQYVSLYRELLSQSKGIARLVN